MITIVCSKCGSDHVSRDAWADWDVESQDWVLGAVFDAGFCHRCEGEASLAEVVLNKRLRSAAAPERSRNDHAG